MTWTTFQFDINEAIDEKTAKFVSWMKHLWKARKIILFENIPHTISSKVINILEICDKR